VEGDSQEKERRKKRGTCTFSGKNTPQDSRLKRRKNSSAFTSLKKRIEKNKNLLEGKKKTRNSAFQKHVKGLEAGDPQVFNEGKRTVVHDKERDEIL